MTLAEFRHLTEFLPPNTPIFVLDPNNEPVPAGVADIDDPVLLSFPRGGILLEALSAD